MGYELYDSRRPYLEDRLLASSCRTSSAHVRNSAVAALICASPYSLSTPIVKCSLAWSTKSSSLNPRAFGINGNGMVGMK